MTIYLYFSNLICRTPLGKFLLMAGLYFGGIVVGIIVALIMNKTAFRGNPIPFVMELPNYRFPSAKNVLLLLWEKAWDFLRKAFTVIMLASVIIWFLSNFTPGLYPIPTDPTLTAEDSILGKLGSLLAVLFRPLGFGSWQAVTALISGFSAKEAVVSTLKLLSGASGSLTDFFAEAHTLAAVVSFLTFTLIYTPCVAAIAAIRAELGRKEALLVVLLQCSVAWVVSFLVYRIGVLAEHLQAVDFLVLLAVFAALIAAIVVLRRRKKSGKCSACCNGCPGCTACANGRCTADKKDGESDCSACRATFEPSEKR